jgi:uncharacterized repeat protein (TIGR02543 family)
MHSVDGKYFMKRVLKTSVVALLSTVLLFACGGEVSITNPTPLYTVTYNGNNNTGGSVPIDSTNYQQGQIVTVLGNTGNLVKTNYTFAGWNTQANGSGATYTQGQTFAMGTANVTLYAVWTPGTWTWMSGSNSRNQPGVYGTQGVAAGVNVPGAREGAVSWIDGSGNLWLFGGYGETSGYTTELNDLWKFDGTNCTWVSGSSSRNQPGGYGTRGVAAGSNVPGSRYGAISWIDGSGNLWLFGGYGYDSAGNLGYLNDLWEFQP